MPNKYRLGFIETMFSDIEPEEVDRQKLASSMRKYGYNEEEIKYYLKALDDYFEDREWERLYRYALEKDDWDCTSSSKFVLWPKN